MMLKWSDIRERINTEEFEKIRDIIAPELMGGPFLAGGSVRRLLMGIREVPDYDVFFASQKQMDEWISRIRTLCTITKEVKNDNNITFYTSIDGKDVVLQAIHKFFYDDYLMLLSSFDFTICQFACDNNFIAVGDNSLLDLMRKRLVVNRVTFGVSTIRRLIKYSNQGFYACSGTMEKILRAVVDNPSIIRPDVISLD